MTNLNVTETVIEQGKALVRAIEAMGMIHLTGWFERAIVGLIMAAYKQRLRAIVAAVPDWMTKKMLTASEHIGNDAAAV
jgi:hypothetical protein